MKLKSWKQIQVDRIECTLEHEGKEHIEIIDDFRHLKGLLKNRSVEIVKEQRKAIEEGRYYPQRCG